MTEPEISFAERLPKRNPRRIALLVGASLAIVVGAAVTMGASPSVSPATAGATVQPGASGNPTEPNGGQPKGVDREGRGAFGARGPWAITISAISGSTLTLTTEDGWTRTIAVTSATTITKAGQAIAVGQLAVGDSIHFKQQRGSDGSFTITAIAVVLPRVAGTVTGVTAEAITLTARGGTTRTITTNSSTTYRMGGAAASRSDVSVGSTIIATGTEGSGNAFTAARVTIKVPRVIGTVTAKTATTITITRRDGTSQTINVGAGTTYKVAGVTAANLGDLAVGMRLEATGRQNADGSLDATAIRAGNGKFHGGPWKQNDSGDPGPSTSPSTSG
jgi:hypothetical protein